MSGAPPIEFDAVWKSFRLGESATALRDLFPNLFRRALGRPVRGERSMMWALRDVSFTLQRGEVLGLVGANGAGKSTCLKLTAGILRPNRGAVHVRGRLSALIEVAAGFHPDLTGRENVYLNGSLLGLRRREVHERIDEILDFADLRDFADTPVKRYSTGMYMRLGFAVAVHVDPDILLIDEVLAVGDLGFRQKCMDRMKELRRRGKTILFVSHKMNDVRAICDRVILLARGGIEQDGKPLDVTRELEAVMRSGNRQAVVGAKPSQVAGSSKFRVEEVSMADRDGATIDELPNDAGFRVRGAVFAEEPVRDPILAVSLLRSDNLRVCHFNTREAGRRIELIDGRLSFEFEFPPLSLIEDLYTVETVLWNAEMNVPLAQHLNPSFTMRDRHPPANRPGVFHADAALLALEPEGKV